MTSCIGILRFCEKSILSNYGERSSDNAMLNIRFQKAGDSIVIAGKRYYQPKQYAALSSVANAITFRSGEKFDFFIEGTYSESVVDDDSYTAGFYDYMNKTIDEVYAVTSVSKYSIIPHFTLTGR